MSEGQAGQKPGTYGGTNPVVVKGNKRVSEDFDAFVQEKLRSIANGGRLDLELEKQFWLGKLDELYSMIEDGLSHYIEAGEILFRVTDFKIHEQLIGEYTARRVKICLAREIVTLRPVGTFLIGNRGRVKMAGAFGTASFVIVPPDAERINVTCTDYHEVVDGRATSLVLPPNNWVWKIEVNVPRGAYVNLDIDTFRETFVGIMGEILGGPDE